MNTTDPQNADDQEALKWAQLDAIGDGEIVVQSDFQTPAHRADFASMVLPGINATIRRTLAHHEAGKPTAPDYPPPYDRLTCLYDARRDTLAHL